MSSLFDMQTVMTFEGRGRDDRYDRQSLDSWFHPMARAPAGQGLGEAPLGSQGERIMGTMDRLDGVYFFHFDQAYTVEDVANRLGVSESHVRKLVASGSLVAINVGLGGQRRDLRVRDKDLEAFAEGRKVDGQAAAPAVAPAAAASRRPGPKPRGTGDRPPASLHPATRKGYEARRAERLAKRGA